MDHERFDRIERTIKIALIGLASALALMLTVGLVAYACRTENQSQATDDDIEFRGYIPANLDPAERDPVFIPKGTDVVAFPDGKHMVTIPANKAAEFERRAMHAVYDTCSKFYVFREGSTLKADYHSYKRAFSTVEVNIANPAKAKDNVLWYQVFFDGDRPVSFKATKTIAAELCGLPDKDVEVKFDTSNTEAEDPTAITTRQAFVEQLAAMMAASGKSTGFNVELGSPDTTLRVVGACNRPMLDKLVEIMGKEVRNVGFTMIECASSPGSGMRL